MKRSYYLSFTSGRRLTILFLAAMFMFGVAVKAQTYTITFQNPPPATTDPTLDQNDRITFGGTRTEESIETGVRFRVTQPGTITGILFYKGNLVTGTHIGHLWTNAGSQLAQATFSETANGWQEVAVSVHISAGVNYVASVFSSIGDYAAEPIGSSNWLGTTDFGTNPIKVIASGNGGNGVFDYLFNPPNTAGAFPTSGGANGVNYWIDIRFQPDFSLPVTIADFKATTASNNILLNWKTESESNNDGFEIQRSNNGIDWYAVSFVKGAGQSSIFKNYIYTDKSLAPGLYYYRLKQMDFDGKSKTTAVVTASVTGKGNVTLFQNTPNPFRVTTTIRFDLPKAQKVKLSVFDMAGREIKVLTDKTSEAGSHLVTLDAATLSRQLYLVKLQTEDGVLTKTILVQ
jgi:Domain of unknown function (DUF4082)/Secretion system C-terminal sorting domain